MPDSDLAHLVVLEAGNHQAHQVVESGNLEERLQVEGRACQLEGSEVVLHWVGMEETACHDRPEEEVHLACRMVEEACLLMLGAFSRRAKTLAYQEEHQETEEESHQHQREVEAEDLLDLHLRRRM
jgi:hypothetical protein